MSAALPAAAASACGVCAPVCARLSLCVLLSLSSQMYPQLSLHCSVSVLARALSSSPLAFPLYLSTSVPPSSPLSLLLTQQPRPLGSKGGRHSFSPGCLLRARSPLAVDWRLGAHCAPLGCAVWISQESQEGLIERLTAT